MVAISFNKKLENLRECLSNSDCSDRIFVLQFFELSKNLQDVFTDKKLNPDEVIFVTSGEANLSQDNANAIRVYLQDIGITSEVFKSYFNPESDTKASFFLKIDTSQPDFDKNIEKVLETIRVKMINAYTRDVKRDVLNFMEDYTAAQQTSTLKSMIEGLLQLAREHEIPVIKDVQLMVRKTNRKEVGGE